MPPPSKLQKRTAKANECRRQNIIKRKELEEQLSESSESDSGYLSLSCSSDSSESAGEGEAGEDDGHCSKDREMALFGLRPRATALQMQNTTARRPDTLSSWIIATETNRKAFQLMNQQHRASNSLPSLPAVVRISRQNTLTGTVPASFAPNAGSEKKSREYRQGLRYTGTAQTNSIVNAPVRPHI
ncbi:hypothetical protein BC829DRAFT_166205 [Chytridium lagenaria]|nr:hypothetical protein BC829DRAFT_166205 [Chytridium lagenaria]